MYRALKHLPLQIENNGEATRDFIYVEDIVHGLLLCAVTGQPGDVYNLASGVETSILELANLINAMADNPAPLEFLPGRAWDHSIKRFGSTEKALRGMGFNARIPLQEGIRLTMDWTRQNIQTLEACILKHAPHMNVQEPASVVLKDI
jgi:nucleoside-diphosphate-sugar epimerase